MHKRTVLLYFLCECSMQNYCYLDILMCVNKVVVTYIDTYVANVPHMYVSSFMMQI